jgi:hypothetical protein
MAPLTATVRMAMVGASIAGELIASNPARAVQLPETACRAAQLTIHIDSANEGGMSHGGALLTVTNVSTAACRLPSDPDVVFLGKAHQKLASSPAPARPNSTASVMLEPGKAAHARLRWIDADVFAPNARPNCTLPAYLRIVVDRNDSQALTARLHVGAVCAAGARSVAPISTTPFGLGTG